MVVLYSLSIRPVSDPRDPQNLSGWSPRNIGWPRMRRPEVPMVGFREIPIARLPGVSTAPRPFSSARPASADGYPTSSSPDQSPDWLPTNPPVALWSGQRGAVATAWLQEGTGNGHGHGNSTSVGSTTGRGIRCFPTLTYPDWTGREERTARSIPRRSPFC